MAYTKVGPFTDGSYNPPINASFLNGLETAMVTTAGIADMNTQNLQALTNDVATAKSNITNVTNDVTKIKTRTNDLFYNVKDYGAVGDDNADDTGPIQAAIQAALDSSNPSDVQSPKYTNSTPVVYFPKGTYSVNRLYVNGTVKLTGPGTYAYASATLHQRADGQDILYLQEDTDGTSNATVIEGLTFRSTTGTSLATAAQIKTKKGIGSNSVYIRNCWFITPERYAIWFYNGDDIKIIDNTFDVAPFHGIKLGDTGSTCSNVQILDNTFYDIALRHIDIVGATGVQINNNKAYKGSQSQPSVFVETVDIQTSVKNITVAGNQINGIKRFLHIVTATRAFSVTGNTVTGNYDSALTVDGPDANAILQGFVMTGNTLDNAGSFGEGAAFRCQTAAMQGCVIANNSVIAQSTTALVFNMPNAKTTNNIFNNNPRINVTNYANFDPSTNNG